MIEIIRLHDVPLRFNLQSFINADLEDIKYMRTRNRKFDSLGGTRETS